MNQEIKKNILASAVAVTIFLILSMVYFSPVFEGKQLQQHDVQTWKGMSREIKEFKEETGEKTFWTNTMFSGMPTYLINTPAASNMVVKIHSFFANPDFRPISHLFWYFLSFFILLLAFNVDRWLSIAGALAYGLSTYFLIIIAAGHLTKAIAIGYMPIVVGGFYLVFNGKRITGGLLMAFFLTFQLLSNHVQIVYYTLLTCAVFGLLWLIDAVKQKKFNTLLINSAVAIVAILIAVAINFPNLYLTYDYGKYSIRGASELSHNQEVKTSGLDKDYATQWSYGIDETLTLLVPNMKGGASGGELSTSSNTYEVLKSNNIQGAKQIIKQLPLYWGDQPGTSGPVYVGAIVIFLFFLSLFLVKGTVKIWVVILTIASIMLAWGHNFMPLTSFFLDYFPGYNKFRTVTMILVIAEMCIPLLAFIGLNKILTGDYEKKDFIKGIKWSLGITGGITLILGLFAGAFYSFEAPADARLMSSGWPEFLIEALCEDRKEMLQGDAFRSLVFILIAAALIWYYYKEKIKPVFLIGGIAVLILIDLYPVNKRYLNEDNFARPKEIEATQNPSPADQFILQDSDPHYRVLNLSVSPFQDGATSYFHKSVGGYHGAKLRRYQELYDHYFTEEFGILSGGLGSAKSQEGVDNILSQLQVLNMLNTKYIILDPKSRPLKNSYANGNAWFIQRIEWVEDADAEIAKLGDINTKTTAVINRDFEADVHATPSVDSLASITLVEYKPNYLKYESNTNSDQIALFSEIYYPKGWEATIDGMKSDIFRANYVLRGISIPSGSHTIEFSFTAEQYYTGNKISLVAAIILLLSLIGAIAWYIYKSRDNQTLQNG